eukprot:m.68505 g.68505  ORF g.68505 m.68505 type:complete len:66 (-) comp8515_c0_seq1:236-433(-)
MHITLTQIASRLTSTVLVDHRRVVDANAEAVRDPDDDDVGVWVRRTAWRWWVAYDGGGGGTAPPS